MSKAVEPSGEFMELLSDALRAGPGSPEWHQAVLELRKQGGEAQADEYTLLWTARERLASGKDYRSVKPGPGFTRRLMDGIERLPAQGKKTRTAPVATIIAVTSLLVLVGVVAIVAYWIYGTRPATLSPTREDPAALVFVQPTLDHDFRTSLPADWRAIGSLPLVTDNGLRPGVAPAADYTGGGIVSPALPAAEPFALEIDLQGSAADGLVPQIFVTDRAEFSPDRATGPHELVWTLQEGQAQVVLPTGRVEGARQPVDARTTVRLVVTRDAALVETDGQRLWAGPHGLASDRPRYVGVRFLAKAGRKSDLAVTALRVQKPAVAR
jgi:hypothetical protein